MTVSHDFNPNAVDNSRFQKPGKVQLQHPADVAGQTKFNDNLPADMVQVTTVSIHAEEVQAPAEINFFGYKIDLKSKIDGYKQKYASNYAQTKSHNLMVARFAQVKTAFFGALLSSLGVSRSEIKNIQDRTNAESVKQNKLLFAENEYNGELMAVAGSGGKRQIRAQEKIIGEIRNQLTAQAKNLGVSYSQERVLEIKIEQCQKILAKFQEEKTNLEYQLGFCGVSLS